MKKATILASTLTIALLMLVLSPALALGAPMTFQKLAERLPAASNAVVAINVSKVMASPYAKREHWGTNYADAWAKQPVMIPPGAVKLIMAASVKPSTMDSYWEMSLCEMSKMPSIKELADAEGGHIDRVWDKEAAYSPINAYFVPIEPTVLASITPAERVEISRWVRQPVKPNGSVTSAYINGVIATLDDKTDMVMAMDLEGAYGLPSIRKFIEDNDIKEITKEKLDMTVEILGGMKGITLHITVGETITGRATVDFEQNAAQLKDSALPVLLEVLNRVGLGTADVKTWKVAVTGKQVSMQGTLSAAGLRELLGVVQSPIPAATTVDGKPAAAPAGAGTTPKAPANPAEASQRYYKTVTTCVSGLREGTSVGATAISVRNAAKRIDQLPILHVDPALVQWGGMVSAKLKQVAGVLSVGQNQINARVAGVPDPEYTTYHYDSNGASGTTITPIANSNTKAERRQAATQAKVEAQHQMQLILNEVAETTPKIRAEMVEKYKVEF